VNGDYRSGGPPCLPADDAAQTGRQAGTPAATGKSRLWLWFVAAFLIQIGAWTAWFTIASQHKVQEVPLATGGAGK